ncbi:MAG: PhzF family phenazine biosynthesis isomerase [Pseudomonadota bacterium]|nr:PhzF family phenazine biosynthesis isomerase [Pseudomonadota bacterium]
MRLFQVDAFTRTRFTGNPAAVVLDADGQDDATLKSIAREFAQTEVAFVSAATAPDHDVRLRFFNARKEAPFVGHATIAAHAVLLALGRRGPGVCRQHSGTGIIEVRVRDQGGTLIEFRQSRPELDAPLPLKTTLRVAEALHLPGARLHEAMPARIARKGSTRLLVPVQGAEALDALSPHLDTLISLGNEIGVDGFFVFSVDRGPQEASLVTESRMFCPALGIPEDPVSGNAHAMLASYLWELGQLDQNTLAFVGRQGRHMNRPGEVSVKLEVEHGSLVAAHIGGSAVIVSEGTLSF